MMDKARGWASLRAALCVATVAMLTGFSDHASAASGTPPAVDDTDQLMVKYRDNPGVARGGTGAPLRVDRLEALRAQAAKQGLVLTTVRETLLGAHVLRLNRKLDVAGMALLIDRLKAADPQIEYVDPDRELHALAFTPNDEFVPNYQWNLFEDKGGIRAKEAWDEEWQGWIKADERFFVKGKRLVRYGEYGRRWTYREIEGDAQCNPPFFNNVDPVPNVFKRCEVSNYWKTIATEGTGFQVAAASWVRYGWGDNWVYKKVSAETVTMCAVAGFGRDPWLYVNKICQVEDRTDGGGMLAVEGQQFYVPAGSTVRYGARPFDTDGMGRWKYRRFATGGYYDCTVQGFGGSDPYPNVWKQCERVRHMGSGVVIAVLDYGHVPHADINDNIVAGYDFVTSPTGMLDGGGRDPDASDPGSTTACGGANSPFNWHGLQVAGVAAAVVNNAIGIAGVAPFARLQPVRVLGKCANRSSDAVDGIVWAAGGTVQGTPAVTPNPTPARVINMSYGSYETSCEQSLADAIAYARSRNAVLVAGVGNNGLQTDGISLSPARCRGVVAVGGTTREGGRAPTSDYGPMVALSAPAGGNSGWIMTLTNSATSGPAGPGGDGYRYQGGNSFAAPHVAGVAALMIGKNPSLSGANVEARLNLSARTFPVECSGCGQGIVDADRALRSAEAITTETEPNDDPLLNANYVSASADVVGTLKATDDTDNYSLDLPPGASITAALMPSSSSDPYTLALRFHNLTTLDLSAPGPGKIAQVGWTNFTSVTQRLYLTVRWTDYMTGSQRPYTLWLRW